MIVTLTPTCGEQQNDQIKIANKLLEDFSWEIEEVQLTLNGEIKVMKTYHTELEIQKHILPTYKDD